MWAAISFSVVTIATAFFLAGPIVALVMTMFLSTGLLLTTHLVRRAHAHNAGTLMVVKALPGQGESSLLQRKAS